MDSKSKGKQKTPLTEQVFITAVITAGVALQFVTGGFDFTLISFPVNILFLLIFIFISTVRPASVLGRFGYLPVSLILITLISLFSILMGLLPGNNIKSSWPFALIFLMLMANLALTVGRRLRSFKLKDTGFVLNHLGLFILLFSIGFGRGDLECYFMKVYEGKVEWRGENVPGGELRELPVAIMLDNFCMEFYPATMETIAAPEPKSYSSHVEVYSRRGVTKSGTVKVNHPLSMGSWKIYQYSYDTNMGKDSKYSVFELVYDPWSIPAYIGIFMLFAGMLTLFWKGGGRRV